MPLAPGVLERVQGDIRPLRAHFNHAGMSRWSSVARGDLEQVGQTALATAPRDS